MERITSLDEYYAIVKAAKGDGGALKTNCMLFPDALQRYIRLGRLGYEVIDAGVAVLADEENFYQVFAHVHPDVPFRIERKEKPLLFQNMYKGEKKPWMLQVEESLSGSGFALADTLKQGIFTGYDSIPRIRRSATGAERIFRREGFTLAPLRKDQIPEMLAFEKTIDEISFYQFPYYTDEEYMEEAQAGRLCCVTDAEGRIIGARHLIVNGKKAYGWVGVEEQYKTRYGVALMFLVHALDYIEKYDIKMCSWVKTTNVPSLQYHERLGTDWTGHLEDEWLLM